MIRSILAAALLAADPIAAIAEPALLAVLPASRTLNANPDPTSDAVAGYAERAGKLRHLALASGRVDYAQVVASAYPAGSITADLLATKAAWRATLASRGGFVVLADYQLLQSAAQVEELHAAPDPLLKSTLVAQYEAIQHRIGLAPVASDFCVFHEAGHALQREALRARGCGEGPWAASHSADDRFDAMLLSGRADATSVARLRYLASQDELEVRLQDLNRFHALCVTGHPIVSPSDTLRALIALGVSVNFEDAHAAFAAGAESFSRAEYLAIIDTTALVPADSTSMFEDARELRLLRRLALRADPDGWRWILAKILFEAPGHL